MSLKNFVVAILLIALVSVLVNSCKKYTGPDDPVITLSLPGDTALIHTGDTIRVEGAISDNKSLHHVFINFKNAASDSVLFDDQPYVHGAKRYAFNFTWYPDSTNEFVLFIDAGDHDNNAVQKTFRFSVN